MGGSLIYEIAKKAKEASRLFLWHISTEKKNQVLIEFAENILSQKGKIFEANTKDVKEAKKRGLSDAFVDRLLLNEKRINGMSRSLRSIAQLEDPVGQVISTHRRPNGLLISKVRVPLGVICIIYESRPNVTSDCAGLCLKSGNAVILRGGSEALNTNIAIFKIIKEVCRKNDIPDGTISMIEDPDKKLVDELLGMNEYIDLVIPRGGEGLIKLVTEKSKIPVIKHYKGICHIYVDEYADLNMAESICYNAKVQRPGVCNAMETLLVHTDVAVRFLPSMFKKFRDAGVILKGCPKTLRIVKDTEPATEEDWKTEYLALILSVKVVESLDEAVAHIERYGSMHSDAIVTDNYQNALEFTRRVDSACVYVNASTRFTDGGEFGMGAEMGISTDKLHARGPMGLAELTTYKYVVMGTGQIRE